MTINDHAREVELAVFWFAVGWFLFLVRGCAGVPAAIGINALLTFTILLGIVLAFSVTAWVEKSKLWLQSKLVFRTALVWSLVMIFILASATMAGAVPWRKIVVLTTASVFSFWLFRSAGVSGNAIAHPWRIGAIVFALWGPVWLNWYGGPSLPIISQFLNFERLLILILGLFLFLAVAPLPNIGYTFRLGWRDLKIAGIAFVALAAVLIPLGLGIGFIHWHTSADSVFILVERAFKKCLFTAMPEELLFRGVVQGVIMYAWRWPRTKAFGPLLVASIIFGAEHLRTDPMPNWPYMLMATLAGIAYGWVWQKTGKITAAALTHSAVDWVWVTYF